MPKPVKKAAKKAAKRPSSDPMTRAQQLMDEHFAKAQEGSPPWSQPAPALEFDAAYRAHMAKLGSKGGKVSGKKRMEMPEEKRKAIAKKGAEARWGKKDDPDQS
ncbi:MAG: hypothetical protein SH850_02120 [Planctomycetaceae bacterium]|nr:hypothetical protein [Planctomycetaceae bacterium]